ncbi:hypothetical protein Bcen2424_1200 [Burkholderia cenocepacia HI2424]|nr:hypothetical protein Bcen2424_1200 [Burkholderia cenocepacia HI2424]
MARTFLAPRSPWRFFLPVVPTVRPDASGPYYPPIAANVCPGLLRACLQVRCAPLSRSPHAKKSATPAVGIARETAWSADE